MPGPETPNCDITDDEIHGLAVMTVCTWNYWLYDQPDFNDYGVATVFKMPDNVRLGILDNGLLMLMQLRNSISLKLQQYP